MSRFGKLNDDFRPAWGIVFDQELPALLADDAVGQIEPRSTITGRIGIQELISVLLRDTWAVIANAYACGPVSVLDGHVDSRSAPVVVLYGVVDQRPDNDCH